MSNNTEYMRVYMLDRYKRRREAAVVFLGGVCVECGGMDDLQFHHKDPSTKLFTLAKGSSFSNSRWDAEVAKCELLCGDCHREEHKHLRLELDGKAVSF